jgi:hypothetical protein
MSIICLFNASCYFSTKNTKFHPNLKVCICPFFLDKANFEVGVDFAELLRDEQFSVFLLRAFAFFAE